MSSISASVFILCIVKLQEFCYRYGFSDYSVLAFLLIDACKVDGGTMIISCSAQLEQIRNSEPFISLDRDQEIFVYETFKQLKSGI